MRLLPNNKPIFSSIQRRCVARNCLVVWTIAILKRYAMMMTTMAMVMESHRARRNGTCRLSRGHRSPAPTTMCILRRGMMRRRNSRRVCFLKVPRAVVRSCLGGWSGAMSYRSVAMMRSAKTAVKGKCVRIGILLLRSL